MPFFLIYPLLFSCLFFFFFNDTATTEIYTLSLHDALPICNDLLDHRHQFVDDGNEKDRYRSEEHTSELQSQFHIVCRLLLEKKKTIHKRIINFKKYKKNNYNITHTTHI